MTIQRYWKPPGGSVDGAARMDENESLDLLDELLLQSVSDRMISDVPLGALLSGGVDSSLVVALMKKVSNAQVKTFSIGFIEKAYDEAPWAAKIAKQLETDHLELYIKPDEALEIVPKLPDIYDEPFADASAIPTVLVSRLARSTVAVALSGDGGDEQFAGYVRYWMIHALTNGLKHVPGPIRNILAYLLEKIPPTLAEGCYNPLKPALPQRYRVADFQEKWGALLKLLRKNKLSELYRPTICMWPESELKKLTGQELPPSNFEALFTGEIRRSTLSQLMLVDLETYLPDAMLTKVDRASMSVSLEVRVPLLDHRLVEYTMRLPDMMKYRNGTGKYLLKKLLARYLPAELFQRSKMGFGIPLADWLRNELKDLMMDHLSPNRIRDEGMFDGPYVQRVIAEHLSGRTNHQYKLWSLLNWQMWKHRWVG